MRIIGGKYKGRRITVYKGFYYRPTTDYAKEGLFNVLTNHFDFQKVNFLDLYCGTGSIGIEACSRGCPKAELVDINRYSINHIKQIIRDLNIKGARAISMEALQYIKVCHDCYHLVFADPPYDYSILEELPGHILNSKILYPEGWFVLEHSAKHSFSDNSQLIDERQYGNVRFSIFRGN